MKITNTPEQIAQLLSAIHLTSVRLFRRERNHARNDAQANLEGRTHYVDPDTLRFHHSRVLTAGTLADGLLYWVGESCSLDWENTRRGYRFVVFDVWGDAVTRPDLEHCKSTMRAAGREFERVEFDLVAHYRDALARQRSRAAAEAKTMETAFAAMTATCGLTSTP